MSRFDRMDVMVELIELCKELRQDIMLQLNYYRASVYKSETAKIINSKLDQLKIVVSLLNQEEILDLFRDFEASRSNGNVALAPGECLLSSRLTHLFLQLDEAFEQVLESLQQHNSSTLDGLQFAKNIQRHRRQLLAICRQGSRQWSFFRTIDDSK
ncbi:MAG: hypothetical protein ACOH5I_02225 [Oligoflexus sp.]